MRIKGYLMRYLSGFVIAGMFTLSFLTYTADKKQNAKEVQSPAKLSQHLLLSDLWPTITAYSNRMKLRQDVITTDGEDDDRPIMLDICFSPDSKRVACAGADRKVRIYDFKEKKVVHTLNHEHEDVRRVNAVDYGNVLLATGDDAGLVWLWNPENGKKKSKVGSSREREELWVQCLKFNPSNTHIAAGGDCKQAHVWDLATLQKISSFKGHKDTIKNLLWLSDTRIVTASDDKKMCLWDSRSGKKEKALNTCGKSKPRCFCLQATADASTLVWQSEAKMHVWDLQADKMLREYSMTPYYFQSVALSHDDQIIVTTTSTGDIDLYDRITGQKIDNVDIEPVKKEDGRHYLSKLIYAPNNNHMAGYMNDSMYIWDLVAIDEVLDK